MRLSRALRHRGAVACVVVLLWVSSVPAEPFSFDFEGHIDFIHDFVDLDESVYLGAPFAGHYTFDPAGISDFYPQEPSVGLYQFGAAGRMWVRIGNYEFVTQDLSLFIVNDRPDVYQVGSFSVSDAGGYQWQAMAIVLADETRTAFNSDALVTTVPDWDAFATFRGLLLDLPGDDLGLRGTLTSLTPEPSSLVLFALASGILCGQRRR